NVLFKYSQYIFFSHHLLLPSTCKSNLSPSALSDLMLKVNPTSNFNSNSSSIDEPEGTVPFFLSVSNFDGESLVDANVFLIKEYVDNSSSVLFSKITMIPLCC